MTLQTLPLVRLRFDLESLEPIQVPAYKGDLLRMALLWWLSEFWCQMPERCRRGCRRPDVCLFGRLCEPPVDPAWPAKIRHLVGDSPPPAYALWDLRDRRTRFEIGAPWSFELTLVGELALHDLPAVVAAVQEGSERGMGRIRWRSRLRRVTALVPGDGPEMAERCLALEKPRDGEMVLTWQSCKLDKISFGYGQAAGAMPEQDNGPVRTLSLRYQSPVNIKMRKERVKVPTFSPVMRAVVRRLRILSQVHGAGEWPHAEYGPLLDVADQVQLEHHETFWSGYERRSKASGRYDVEGFVGQAWYRGDDLRPLLPALWLGQWLHVGKGYVAGSGRYEIVTD